VSRQLNKPASILSYELYLETARITESSLVQLQYQQAIYNVITGQYLVSEADALYLGSLHFLHKFNEYQPLRHRVGFLGGRIAEFIPSKWLKLKSIEQWENLLLENVKDLFQMMYGSKVDTSSSRSPQHGLCSHMK
jgi:hypothetical protein